MPLLTWARRTKHLAYSFAGPCMAYLAWENKEVASFLVKYRPYSWPCSLLIFCPITLVFVLFNSTKTLFSYNMCYNGLHSRMWNLDMIKKPAYMAILNGTKWSWDCTPDVLLKLLHTLVLTWNWSILSPWGFQLPTLHAGWSLSAVMLFLSPQGFQLPTLRAGWSLSAVIFFFSSWSFQLLVCLLSVVTSLLSRFPSFRAHGYFSAVKWLVFH